MRPVAGWKLPGEGQPPALSLLFHFGLSEARKQRERLLQALEGSSKWQEAERRSTPGLAPQGHPCGSEHGLISCGKGGHQSFPSMVSFDYNIVCKLCMSISENTCGWP